MEHVFGPVFSRRLGYSLGIDIIPYKICSFDCLYCECGVTTQLEIERKEYIPVEVLVEEISEYFSTRRKGDIIDYITITGSGDPLLHSKLDSILKNIKKITTLPIAVLTNGCLMDQKEVREALSNASLILPSLDAASPVVFNNINRPHKGISLSVIIDSYKQFRKEYPKIGFWLEIVFVKGINDDEKSIDELILKIKEIGPDKIHLNTVTRPPAQRNLLPVSYADLLRIQKKFGEKAQIVSYPEGKTPGNKKVLERLVQVINRRPLSIEELVKITGLDEKDISQSLRLLEDHPAILLEEHNGILFLKRK